MTTGSSAVLGSLRISRSTSNPSTFASLMSSITSLSGISDLPAYAPREKRKSSASAPSLARWTRLASRYSPSASSVRAASSGLSSTNRMSIRWLESMLDSSEGEIKGRALAEFTLSPYTSTMSVDDPLHDRQPDACPGVLGPVVQSLKDSEELIHVSHLETGAVVANVVDGFPTNAGGADL